MKSNKQYGLTPKKVLAQQKAQREMYRELGFVQMRRWLPPYLREDFIAVIEGRAEVVYYPASPTSATGDPTAT